MSILLRTNGCRAYILVPKQQRSKLDAVSQPNKPGVAGEVGARHGTKGWRILVPNVGKLVISRQVKFYDWLFNRGVE